MSKTDHGLPEVKSAMASHAHYDAEKQALTVRFHNGSIFRYDDVPVNVGHTVMGASSFGASFNRHIKGKGTRL